MASPYELNVPLEAERTQKFMGTDTVRAPGALEVTADRGNAGLLEMAAKILPQGIVAIDDGIKKDIEQSLYDATDQVNAEHGVDGRLFGQDVTDPNPINQTEMERMSDTVKNLNAGYKAGRIQDSHYWARLDSIARQMRTRYPGHRTFIDDKISSIVGGTPANRLREEMFAEAKAKAAGGEKDPFEKGVDGIIEKSIEEGWAGLALGQGWEQKVTDGTWNKWDAGRKLMAYQQRFAAIKDKEDIINYEKKLGEVSENNAFDTFNLKIRNNIFTGAATAFAPAAKAHAEVMKNITTLQAQGKPVDENQRLALSRSINQWKTQTVAAARNEMMKDQGGWSYFVELNPQQKEAVWKSIDQDFKMIEDIVSNPTLGMVNELSNFLEGFQKSTDLRLLQDPTINMISSMNRHLTPTLMEHVTLQSGTLPDIVQKARTGALVKLATGEYTSGDYALVTETAAIRNDQTLDPKEKENLVRMTAVKSVEDQMVAITDPTIRDEDLAKTVAAVFGKENEGILRHFKDPDLKREVYFKMANPAVAKRMWELRSKDQRYWDMYKKWTETNFFNLFKQHANELNNTLLHRKYVDINWDGKRLDLNTRSYGQGKMATEQGFQIWKWATGIAQIEEGTELYLNQNADTAVRSINTAMEGLRSVYDLEGGSVDKKVASALAQIGFDKDLKYQGSTVDTMYISLNTAIQNLIKRNKEKSKKTTPTESQEQLKDSFDSFNNQ